MACPTIPAIASISAFILLFLDYHFIRVIIAVGFGLMAVSEIRDLLFYRNTPYIIINNEILSIQQNRGNQLLITLSDIKDLKCTRNRYMFYFNGAKITIYKALISKIDNEKLARTILGI